MKLSDHKEQQPVAVSLRISSFNCKFRHILMVTFNSQFLVLINNNFGKFRNYQKVKKRTINSIDAIKKAINIECTK